MFLLQETHLRTVLHSTHRCKPHSEQRPRAAQLTHRRVGQLVQEAISRQSRQTHAPQRWQSSSLLQASQENLLQSSNRRVPRNPYSSYARNRRPVGSSCNLHKRKFRNNNTLAYSLKSLSVYKNDPCILVMRNRTHLAQAVLLAPLRVRVVRSLSTVRTAILRAFLSEDRSESWRCFFPIFLKSIVKLHFLQRVWYHAA